MSGVNYRSMYWWVSGEVERLQIRLKVFPDDEVAKTHLVRAEAVQRMVGWCADHADEIKEIALRDKARKMEMSRKLADEVAASKRGSADGMQTFTADAPAGE